MGRDDCLTSQKTGCNHWLTQFWNGMESGIFDWDKKCLLDIFVIPKAIEGRGQDDPWVGSSTLEVTIGQFNYYPPCPDSDAPLPSDAPQLPWDGSKRCPQVVNAAPCGSPLLLAHRPSHTFWNPRSVIVTDTQWYFLSEVVRFRVIFTRHVR